MNTIYILLTRSNTLVSRLVYLFTRAEYTHVSISFEENLETMYSSSRKNGRTLFPAGPCRESFRYGWFKRYGKIIPCALYELKVTENAYEQAKIEAEQFMKNADHYHFNILGLILCKFNISWNRKNHFFCSQLVGEILIRSNAVGIPKEPTLMRPSDYMDMEELECLYKGYIYELAQLKTCSQ